MKQTELGRALKFVQGGLLNGKAWALEMSHFNIAQGRVKSTNGTMCLSAPIPLDIDCIPEGNALVKALEKVGSDVSGIHLTEGGKLAITSGKLKIYVVCLEEAEMVEHFTPEGENLTLPDDNAGTRLLEALSTVEPFIGNDAHRIFSTAVLLEGPAITATNNISVIQHHLPFSFPGRLVLPGGTVREMLRIGEAPVGIQVSEKNATFHYSGDRWLYSQLIATEWPDVAKILDTDNPEWDQVPTELAGNLEKLETFLNPEGFLYFTDEAISTDVPEARKGAVYQEQTTEIRGATDYQVFLNWLRLASEMQHKPGERILWKGDRGSGPFRGALALQMK